MLNIVAHARGLSAAALTAVVMLSSHTSVAAAEAADPTDPADRPEIVEEELPQSLSMPAPFPCGTAWRGTTYSGHGANNWNLDLNRSLGDGTDLGQPILAQDDGVVVWFKNSGYNNRAGTYIEVDYGDVTARYLHLVEGSIPDTLTEIGAEVIAGEPLGLLGATGRASGPHLHLEYWDSSEHEDTSRFDLPSPTQLPIVFAGQPMIATPGRPSPVSVSTNCPELEKERLEAEQAALAAAEDAAAEREALERRPVVGHLA